MPEKIQPAVFETTIREMLDSSRLLRKAYFFHDIRVICQTNHPTILAILDEMLGMFAPPRQVRGELSYYVLCYESGGIFPVRLPHTRRRVDTIRLLTNTQLKHYASMDNTTEYQSYRELRPINGNALSVMSRMEPVALTQLEMPEAYQGTFLRRYVFLLALGQVLGQFGFEPCHAATITAPGNCRQGALIIGASGSGKTTLSLSCALQGYGLLGDDLVMLCESRDDEEIEAYTITHEVSVRSHTLMLLKNLSFLRDYPVDQRDKRFLSIEQVRAGAARFQTSVRLLLFPSLTAENTSRARLLSKADTLRMLIDMCMSTGNNAFYAQEKLFHLLSRLAEQASGYQLEIARDTNDGPRLIQSLFAGESHD
ncbi:MAG TPA: hypothetical protein VFA09_22230 [Ktedonobacteraceae bacterium]|jgi:hypothetical protein|nr:hypothetical protein [Ktedonobacteraceae bacterium]